jgi:hypothetical protein
MVSIDEHGRRGAVPADHLHDPAVILLRQTPPSMFRTNGRPQHTHAAKAANGFRRDVGILVDRCRVDMRRDKLPDIGHEGVARRLLARRKSRIGNDRIVEEATKEELLRKANGLRPGKQKFFSLSSWCDT